MEELITAGKRYYPCKYFVMVSEPERLYIRLSDVTIGEIATVFSDPEETAVMTYAGQTVEGFTKLLSIILENNVIRVTLTRG